MVAGLGSAVPKGFTSVSAGVVPVSAISTSGSSCGIGSIGGGVGATLAAAVEEDELPPQPQLSSLAPDRQPTRPASNITHEIFRVPWQRFIGLPLTPPSRCPPGTADVSNPSTSLELHPCNTFSRSRVIRLEYPRPPTQFDPRPGETLNRYDEMGGFSETFCLGTARSMPAGNHGAPPVCYASVESHVSCRICRGP